MIRRKLMLAFGLVALTLPAGVSAAYAAPNPSGTGPPSQTCQTINMTPSNPDQSGATGPFYPGKAANANGSVFAEPGGPVQNGAGGTGGQRYNAVGAPSQYDVACYQQSQKP